MKPDWDKLTAKFEDSDTVLIGDVDCTAEESKPLCEANDVQGFPTLKHGNPDNLQEYDGGREFDDLYEFAKKLKPLCSPAKRELCEKDDLAEIEKLEALGLEELEKQVTSAEKKIKAIESKYKRQVDTLQSKYKKYTDKKDNKIKKAKPGLGIKKSVLAYRKKQAKSA